MNAAGPAAWTALREAGLVRGEAPTVGVETPWYVRLMLGVAGWIAASFLLGFVAVGMSWVIESELACMVGGLLASAAAWWLLRRLGRNEFAAQFGLAVSFAGQALFAYGLFSLFEFGADATVPWLLLALQQALLVAVMPNAIHRGWSGLLAAVAVYMALRAGGLGYVAPALLLGAAAWAWLNEFRWPRHGALLRPAAYGVILALILLELAIGPLRPVTPLDPAAAPAATRLFGQALNGAVLLCVVWALLRRQGARPPERVALAALGGSLAVVLVSLQAPGIATGLCILLLGFAQGNRVLTGLGGAALVLYAGSYYYQLDVTLLVKAQALAATGAVLLTLRWLLLRWIAQPPRTAPEAGHG